MLIAIVERLQWAGTCRPRTADYWKSSVSPVRKRSWNFADPAARLHYLVINVSQTLAHTLAEYPEVLINLSGDFYAKVCN